MKVSKKQSKKLEPQENSFSVGRKNAEAFKERRAAHWAAGNKPVDPYRKLTKKSNQKSSKI